MEGYSEEEADMNKKGIQCTDEMGLWIYWVTMIRNGLWYTYTFRYLTHGTRRTRRLMTNPCTNVIRQKLQARMLPELAHAPSGTIACFNSSTDNICSMIK